MINLIASELFFAPDQVSVTCFRTLCTKRCVYKKTSYTLIFKKKPPRCRANEMIKPNAIRWAVPLSTSGNQKRFP